MAPDPGSILPDDLFGVCTSAYRSEGGFNVSGGPHNHRAGWERSGRLARSGEAGRFWDDPGPHTESAASLGLNDRLDALLATP